jgi:hypothetical protein
VPMVLLLSFNWSMQSEFLPLVSRSDDWILRL